MRRIAHTAIGVVSALAILHPTSVAGIVCDVAGGIIGGQLPDIDLNHHKKSPDDERNTALTIQTISIVMVASIIDYLLGEGVFAYAIKTWNLTSLIWSILLIVGCVLGYYSPHRTFMHSFLALIVFTGLLWMAFKPLALPFGIAFLSHIVLDITNKTGIAPFYPFKKRFKLGLCASDGKANLVLHLAGVGTAMSLVYGMLMASLVTNSDGTLILNLLRTKVYGDLNVFQCYLITINVFMFIVFQPVYSYTGKRYLETHDSKFESYVILLLNIPAALGGAIGLLLALFLHHQYPIKNNVYWFILIHTLIIGWGVIYLVICNPFNLILKPIQNWTVNDHLPLLTYWCFINVALGLLVWFQRKATHKTYVFIEKLQIFLGINGGAIGGLIACIFAEADSSIRYFYRGLEIMVAENVLVYSYILYAGLA